MAFVFTSYHSHHRDHRYSCVLGPVRGIVELWQSEDNFVELILSFHIYVGSRDQAQVTRPAWRKPLPT